HLRQLSAAGLVTDATPGDLPDGQASSGRQRWWKAVNRSTFTTLPPGGDEEAEAVKDEFAHAALSATHANARRWLSVSHSWPRPWRQTAVFSDVALRLTRDEAAQLGEDIANVVAHYRRQESADEASGAVSDCSEESDDTVIVTAQYQIFPWPDQDPPDGS